MSFKLRFKYKYRNAMNFVRGLELPGWCTCGAIRLLLLILIVGLGTAYAIKTSAFSTSGYELHSLEQEVATLNNDIQKLETDVASYQSMSSIQERLKGNEMVAANKVIHLKNTTDVAVAQR